MGIKRLQYSNLISLQNLKVQCLHREKKNVIKNLQKSRSGMTMTVIGQASKKREKPNFPGGKNVWTDG